MTDTTDTTITQIGGSSIDVYDGGDCGIRVVVDTTNYLSHLHEPPGMHYSTTIALHPEEAVKLAHRLLTLAYQAGQEIAE